MRAVAQSRIASCPPHDTVVAALERGAADRAPLITIHGGGAGPVRLDARDVRDGAARFGVLLEERGVRRGDPVPILLPTSPDFVHALLGTMMIGAIPAPLATPMTFGSVGRFVQNLAAVVEDAGARTIVTTPRFRDAIAAEPAIRELVRDVVVPEEETLPAHGAPRGVSIGAADTALLQYTSGTTGRPKGVVVSHRALVANAYAIARGLAIGPSEVGVSWLPMFHDMGLIGVLLTAVCHPYPVHLVRPESFVMQPRRWLELLSAVGGTISAAPNFAYDLCTSRIDRMAEVDLRSWRVALNGSEPVHASTIGRFEARFGAHGFRPDAMMPVYGLAESTLAVTFPSLESKLEPARVDRSAIERGRPVVEASDDDALTVVSVGEPVAGASVRIVDGGRVVDEGVVGEVETSGPSVMDGYYRNDAASAAALDDGWLRTGDLGFLDRGRLFLVGRAKEVIIKGGRNYYPHDVERVVADVAGSGIAAAAFAETNEAAGTEDLVVVIEARDRSPEACERIARDVRGELLSVLGVKADRILLWPPGAIPRTTSGKIRREACRRAAASEAP